MFYSALFSLITGFITLIGLLYGCHNEIDKINDGTTSAQTVINIINSTFRNSLDGKIAPIITVLFTVLLLTNTFFNGFNHFTVTTRMGYALARDNALPGSFLLNY